MGKNTSNNCSLPILGQLLSFVPREVFNDCIQQYESNKWYKKLKTWDQFVFMFYAVLTGSSSIRETCKNFLLMGDKLTHCGIFKVPKRSTLSDANRGKNSQVFGAIYMSLYNHYKSILSDSFLPGMINSEVKADKVEIFDSTTVSLFKEVFKACGRLPENGKRKGGIKAFAKMTLSERVPNFICMKAAATNEKVFLSLLELERGTIAVFDKGFQKFSQYKEWSEKGIFYVTRLYNNAIVNINRQRELEEACEIGVVMDADITLSYSKKGAQKEESTQARMVAYFDPESGKKLVFLTNLMDVKASTVCLLFKNRWTIEPLFKQIKQNFELTYFLSDSEEGIKTQIWIAMILNLIFTVIHKKIKEAEDFATLVKLAAKNTSSYVAFIKFLELSQKQISILLDNLENIQLSLFSEINPVVISNSS